MKIRYLNSLLIFGFMLLPVLAGASVIFISSVEFEGNTRFDTPQLRRLLRLSEIGKRYVAENLRMDLQYVTQVYQDEGFLNVKIGPPEVKIHTLEDAQSAAIWIPVVEGSRYSLRNATVRNVQALPSSTLMQMCPIQKGQPYSRFRISQWQAKGEEAYRAIGHIRARCTVQDSVHESDKTVDCALECTEGKGYRVGKITIVADQSIDRIQFKRRLLLSEGGLFNPEYLTLSIQYLNQMRIYKPISGSDVEIGINDADGTVNLVWHLSLPE